MLRLDAAGNVAAYNFREADAEGRMTLPSAAPGDWRLLVKPFLDAGPTAEADVTVPGAPVRVELPEWGTVVVGASDLAADDVATVQLVAPDGRAYRDVDSGEPRDAWSLSAGGFMAVKLPVGVWTVRMTTSDGRVRERQVTVGAGQEVLVE